MFFSEKPGFCIYLDEFLVVLVDVHRAHTEAMQHQEVAVTLVHGEKEAVTYTKRNVNSEQRLHIL